MNQNDKKLNKEETKFILQILKNNKFSLNKNMQECKDRNNVISAAPYVKYYTERKRFVNSIMRKLKKAYN